MYYPITLFIGFRYLRGNGKDRFARLISWLSTIGIILGVMSLIIVLSVMNGLEQQIEESTLKYMPQAQITTAANKINRRDYPKVLFEKLNGVTQISTLVTTDAILQGKQGMTLTELLGIDPKEPEPVANYIHGLPLAGLTAGSYNIIIGSALARQLGVELGDEIRVILTKNSQITPIGRIPMQRLFTVVGIFSINSDVEQRQAYIHYKDAAKLLRFKDDEISSWRLTLESPLDIERVTQQTLFDNIIFKDWRESKGEFFQAVKMEKRMMALLVGLIILVAAFNIITSLGLLVMEKQNEVAILKTIGLSRKKIMSIFVIQGASAGIFGAIIGTVLGVVIIKHINPIRDFLGLSLQNIALPVIVDSMQVLIIALFAIIIALLSTLYPAWQASKIIPVEALRYE